MNSCLPTYLPSSVSSARSTSSFSSSSSLLLVVVLLMPIPGKSSLCPTWLIHTIPHQQRWPGSGDMIDCHTRITRSRGSLHKSTNKGEMENMLGKQIINAIAFTTDGVNLLAELVSGAIEIHVWPTVELLTLSLLMYILSPSHSFFLVLFFMILILHLKNVKVKAVIASFLFPLKLSWFRG